MAVDPTKTFIFVRGRDELLKIVLFSLWFIEKYYIIINDHRYILLIIYYTKVFKFFPILIILTLNLPTWPTRWIPYELLLMK